MRHASQETTDAGRIVAEHAARRFIPAFLELGGKDAVIITRSAVDQIGQSDYLEFDSLGELTLKGFPEPTELFVARAVTGSA